MRIAIANDDPSVCEALKAALESVPGYYITWMARNGAEAVRRCSQDKPDLILMDLTMAVMDGVDATRQIMAATPCAVLIVIPIGQERSPKVVDALAAGAIDAASFLKSDVSGIVQKIGQIELTLTNNPRRTEAAVVNDLLLVGASAGGPAAFATIIGRLPLDFRAATIFAQHVEAVFVPTLVSWLSRQTALPIQIAEEGDRPKAGTILVADTKRHLVFKNSQNLGYTADPADSPYHPCIDVFFESAAAFRRHNTVAMVLTGMGRDGARGLKALRDAGAITIAQDAPSSVVYGMPKAAMESGAAKEILSVDAIASRLISIFQRNGKRND